jgi:hypothetical protein
MNSATGQDKPGWRILIYFYFYSRIDCGPGLHDFHSAMAYGLAFQISAPKMRFFAT